MKVVLRTEKETISLNCAFDFATIPLFLGPFKKLADILYENYDSMNDDSSHNSFIPSESAVNIPAPEEYGNVRVTVKDSDVTKLILEYLYKKQFSSSATNLEQETGILNGLRRSSSLRQSIQNADYERAASQVSGNDAQITVIRLHQALELSYLYFINDQIDVHDKLVQLLSMLLTSKDLSEYPGECEKVNQLLGLIRRERSVSLTSRFFAIVNDPKWNLCRNKSECIERCMALEHAKNNDIGESTNDRLIQLIVKGLLYETCMEYCQIAATVFNDDDNVNPQSIENPPNMSLCSRTVSVLAETTMTDMDASLLSWLQFLPIETFSCSFAQRNLSLCTVPIKSTLKQEHPRKSLPPPPPPPAASVPTSTVTTGTAALTPTPSHTFDSVENLQALSLSDRTCPSQEKRIEYYRANHMQDAQAIRAVAI
ncbi:hypothetical protein ACOME3_006674 [Neoechinorhynchus agilis]